MGVWSKIKELPWWAISLSLGINIISLFAAILAISLYRDEIPLIVVSFLFMHIFIAQPLKDWLIARMGIGARYSSQTTFMNFENRVSRIMHLQDILEFLSWMIRAWKLSRLRLLVFDTEDFIYYLTNNKRARKMRLKDELSDEFRAELSREPGGRSINTLSPALRAYMQSRKVKFVVPLLFRERLIGLIGFNEVLEKNRQPLLDHAAHRIGLAIENEQLERTVPRSEFLKKEFRLAERIERHLSGASQYNTGFFSIQKLDTAWEKKHFAAIFGYTPGTKESGIGFAMLLRLSVASTRSNALQLFSTQGYFYALCRSESSLSGLAGAMNQSLRRNENRSVALEGFLLQLDGPRRTVGVLAFGSHLAYRDQKGWTWIKESAALGDDSFNPDNLLELAGQKEIILSMREYPLLLISGGHEVSGLERDTKSLGAQGGGHDVSGSARDTRSLIAPSGGHA